GAGGLPSFPRPGAGVRRPGRRRRRAVAVGRRPRRRAGMTPFLQLRLWWRRAPYANKLGTTLTLAIVIGLLAWIVVPTGSDQPSSNTTGVAAVGAAPASTGAAAGATPTTA